MTFASPVALALGLLAAAAVAALYARAARRRRAALMLFGGSVPGAERTARMRRWRAALVVAAVALLGAAAAGPRYGTELRDVRQDGLDLVVVFDVSRSMLAEDVAPSRLLRARFEVGRALDGLAGSRVGLVLFAADAFVQVPLTTDFGAVRQYLAAAHPEAIAAQGTDLGRALEVAMTAFEGSPAGQARARALLVVSDGEDHAERYEGPLRAAEAAGVTVFAAGVGTPEGARIPLPGGGVHVDRAGRPVLTRLDDSTLRQIARSGGYFPIARPGEGLGALPEALTRLGRSAPAQDRFATHAEQYQWPLGLALLLLAAERLLAGARRREGRG